MKKIVGLFILALLTGGCVPILIGTGGAATGYVLSNDAAAGDVKTEYRILWDLCVDKLKDMDAEITGANESKGIIKAKISDTAVTFIINSLDSKTQKLKIAARKYLLPKPLFAQKIYLKITEALE